MRHWRPTEYRIGFMISSLKTPGSNVDIAAVPSVCFLIVWKSSTFSLRLWAVRTIAIICGSVAIDATNCVRTVRHER
jgi:hypothetical protein